MPMRRAPKARCFILISLCLTSSLFAQSRRGAPGTGNPDEHLVPWRFLEKDALLEKSPVTLYWLPASLDESKRSRLMTSRVLLENSTRCVAFEIVLPENVATIEKLGATGKGPTAVVTDAQGNVVRSVSAASAVAVEKLLEDALAARDEAMYRQMTEADRAASAGQKDVAIGLYKKVWDDRCLFPVAGSDAQRALKKLGVVVQATAEARPPDPYLDPKAKPKTKTPH
jgi:hypothetical protein